jgi:hypothetical protein
MGPNCGAGEIALPACNEGPRWSLQCLRGRANALSNGESCSSDGMRGGIALSDRLVDGAMQPRSVPITAISPLPLRRPSPMEWDDPLPPPTRMTMNMDDRDVARVTAVLGYVLVVPCRLMRGI